MIFSFLAKELMVSTLGIVNGSERLWPESVQCITGLVGGYGGISGGHRLGRLWAPRAIVDKHKSRCAQNPEQG